MMKVGVSLTLTTPLDKGNVDLQQGRPIISLSKFLVGKSSTTNMIVAYHFIDIGED